MNIAKVGTIGKELWRLMVLHCWWHLLSQSIDRRSASETRRLTPAPSWALSRMVTTIFAMTVWRMFANYSQTMAEGVFAVTPSGRLVGHLQLLHRWSGIVCLLRSLKFDIDEYLNNNSEKLLTSQVRHSQLISVFTVCTLSKFVKDLCQTGIYLQKKLKLGHLSTKPMSQSKHSPSSSWAPAVITFLHHCHMSRGFTSFYNNQMSLHKDKGECTPLTYSINCTTIYQGPLEGGCSLVQGVSVYIMT